MQLTNAVKYSIILMRELHSKPTTVQAIADKHKLPYDFLQQLSLKLRRAGLTKSVRGPGGGIIKSGKRVSMLDICKAVDYSELEKFSKCPLQQTLDGVMEGIVIVQ